MLYPYQFEYPTPCFYIQPLLKLLDQIKVLFLVDEKVRKLDFDFDIQQ